MVKSYRGFIVVTSLAVVLMRPSLAAAQLSSRDVKGGDLSMAIGQKVSVTTADGRKVKGTVLSLSATTLDIGESGVPTASFAIADVRRVQAADSVTNGVVTGALSLGLTGLLAGALADASNTVGQIFGSGLGLLFGVEPEPVRETNHYATGAVIGVAVGALLGYAIDAGKEKTIYKRETAGMSVAVRPIVSNAGTGVGVQVRW